LSSILISCKITAFKTYPDYYPECKNITISDIQLLDKLEYPCYNVKALIKEIRACYCPPKVVCKPCIPDAIFITDTENKTFNHIIELTVKLGETKQFTEGDYGVFSFIPIETNLYSSSNKFKGYGFSLIGYTRIKKHN